jgi:hypothetical protein
LVLGVIVTNYSPLLEETRNCPSTVREKTGRHADKVDIASVTIMTAMLLCKKVKVKVKLFRYRPKVA